MEKFKVRSLLDFSSPNQVERMDAETARLFASTAMAEMVNGNPQKAYLFSDPEDKTFSSEITQSFQYRVFVSRLPESLKITPEAFLTMTALCSTPGELVMWAYTMRRLSEKLNGEIINMRRLAEEWPRGFPTRDAMKACWEAQKGSQFGLRNVDNMLDRPDLIESYYPPVPPRP